MTQKRLIYADEKDKIRMICENLRASDASAFHFRSLSACKRQRMHHARGGGGGAKSRSHSFFCGRYFMFQGWAM